MDRKLLLILNPTSGRGAAAGSLFSIVNGFSKTGWEVTVIPTQEKGDAQKIARERAADFPFLVCCGGDGTLNETVNGLMEVQDRPLLGYIPAGTTNDFARTLKLPRRIGGMRRVLASGRDVAIDAGRFNDGYFSYVASFGAFTKCSYATPRSMKRLLGHLAYVLEGIRDITALEARPMTVEADDCTYTGEYVFGAFSNTVSIGGMLHYDSALVDMNDGKLEMLLIRKPENLGEVRRLVHALGSSDFDDPLFDFAASSAFHLKTEQGFDWSVDGERAAGGTAVEIACVKSAVRITVPARKD